MARSHRERWLHRAKKSLFTCHGINEQNQFYFFENRSIVLQRAGRLPRGDARVRYLRVPPRTIAYSPSVLLMCVANSNRAPPRISYTTYPIAPKIFNSKLEHIPMRYVKLFFSYIFETPEAKTPQNFRISGWSRPMLILHLSKMLKMSKMLKILDPHSIIQWYFFFGLLYATGGTN